MSESLYFCASHKNRPYRLWVDNVLCQVHLFSSYSLSCLPLKLSCFCQNRTTLQNCQEKRQTNRQTRRPADRQTHKRRDIVDGQVWGVGEGKRKGQNICKKNRAESRTHLFVLWSKVFFEGRKKFRIAHVCHKVHCPRNVPEKTLSVRKNSHLFFVFYPVNQFSNRFRVRKNAAHRHRNRSTQCWLRMPRKKPPFLLGLVLQSLVGQPVCLEIKNDDEIHGTIESVDGDMNVSLLNATYIFAKVCQNSVGIVRLVSAVL